MTSHHDPLRESAHRRIDALCEQFQQNPSIGLPGLADLIAQAPNGEQERAAEELLVCFFQWQLSRGETLDEREARNLGLGPDIIQRAKSAAVTLHQQAQAGRAATTTAIPRDRYQFKEERNRGGFGRVAKYWDTLLERFVAIKLPRDPADTLFEQVLPEVRATCRVNSSRVIQIYDAGMFWDDNPFLCDDPSKHCPAYRPAIVMEFAERGRLSDGLKNHEPYDLQNIARHFPTIAEGVGDIHDAGLVHLDLKPGNILFGADRQPRVSDFGLARGWLNAAPERLGGTYAWMEPRLLQACTRTDSLGRPDPKWIPPEKSFDLWSLGVILYEMLTGQHPFLMHDDWYQRILNPESVVPVSAVRPSLSSEWDHFIHRCLHEKSDKRYVCIRDLINAFYETLERATGRRFQGCGSPAPSPGNAGGDGAGHGGDHGGATSSGGSDSSSSSSRSGAERTSHSDVSHASGFDRRAAELFVGREELLKFLNGVFGDLDEHGTQIRPDDPALVAYLHAMPGSGKTYLIDRWFYLRQERARAAGTRDSAFHVVDQPLDRKRQYTADSLRDELVAKLNLTGPDLDAALRAALAGGFLRIENVDSPDFGHAVVELAKRLNGCRLIITGRWFAKGTIPSRWRDRAVGLLTPEQAEQQLVAEVGTELWNGFSADQRKTLITRTGRLPLAIHLASAFLLRGRSVNWLVERLSLLTLQDGEDSRYGQAVLTVMVEELLTALTQALQKQPWISDADALLAGFRRLGFAHPAGVGLSLASAVSGLSSDDLSDLLMVADSLHLIERDEGIDRFRLHPLIADQLTAGIDRDPVDAAVTDWFCERLPEPVDQTVHNAAWHEIHAEFDTLVSWLGWLSGGKDVSHKGTKAQRGSSDTGETDSPDLRAFVPSCETLVRVERAGSWFAIIRGPYRAWSRLCERGLWLSDDPQHRSNFLWTLANCARSGGDVERALSAASDKAAVDTSRGEDGERDLALARGLEADVLQDRGELDEALRIYREEQLPVYERLGDVREKAVTQGKIADVLQDRGELDEALRIRREEQLPVYERLGDVRAKAVTQGKIADVLQARGELDEALRIRREEQLPVYERLGDVRAKALTQGKIADVLQARGELDEALRICREEVLPVFERLGDVRSKAVTQGKIADVLQDRGELDEALRIRREEELPVYERLGATRDALVCRANLALILLDRNALGDRDEAAELLRQAHAAAEKMGIPEAGQIRSIQQQEGLRF